MRVCPKCGYIDPSEWRHSLFSYWIDISEWEWFKREYPGLAKDLEAGAKVVEDEYYVYRRQGTQFAQRKAKVDYGYQWNIPMEKRRAYDGSVFQDFRPCWDRVKKLTEFL